MALYYWHTQDDTYKLTHGKVRVCIAAQRNTEAPELTHWNTKT